MTTIDTNAIADSTTEIRAAVGIIAMLHAGGQLSAADMRAFVTSVEGDLVTIERCAAGDTLRLPILTLAEVAARANCRAAARLQVIQGGRA